jgi:endonuclease/exonuclease/phosphatase (EEP) superfamily protein YafD
VLAQLELPDGRRLSACCLHCQGSRDGGVTSLEIRRTAEFLEHAAGTGPLVVAGDFNARRSRSEALRELARLGLEEPAAGTGPDGGLGIDHVYVRGLRTVRPVRRWAPAERDLVVALGRRRARLRLSDHDPVSGVFELP